MINDIILMFLKITSKYLLRYLEVIFKEVILMYASKYLSVFTNSNILVFFSPFFYTIKFIRSRTHIYKIIS